MNFVDNLIKFLVNTKKKRAERSKKPHDNSKNFSATVQMQDNNDPLLMEERQKLQVISGDAPGPQPPSRSSAEKECLDKESWACFQSTLRGMQDSMTAFSSQLEDAKRTMKATVADLEGQMLTMQKDMAAGIVQRDQRVAKLETQNVLLVESRGRDADALDLDPPQRLLYDCHFAAVAPTFFFLRHSEPQYPMPDGSFPSYLQPPLDLDRGSPPFV
ncbi:uncharacterized protein [Syngnathus scovelli]|uniref:uncharacterized protein isoform X2 n=1 Tax=Syngnathus scovelli TaxID=161590 RepID=UPI00210FFADB|nr:uncharacterized protein LOC125967010 isoform X2 [Syngnathus scovelli]